MKSQVKKVFEKIQWMNFIVNRFQIAKMRMIVHEIDRKAFMTITEVADVFTSV